MEWSHLQRDQCLRTSQPRHKKERFNTRRTVRAAILPQAPPEPHWLFSEEEQADVTLQQSTGKAQDRQGGKDPPSKSGHSAEASQALPLPPPSLLPFPFNWPQPCVSGAARGNSVDAAEGP